MLDSYASWKSIPTAEVTVMRTLFTVLSQESNNEHKVLKTLKHAHSRASERGSDCFFRKEEVERRELNWFVVTSWNCCTKIGHDKNYDLSAEFLRLAITFFSRK